MRGSTVFVLCGGRRFRSRRCGSVTMAAVLLLAYFGFVYWRPKCIVSFPCLVDVSCIVLGALVVRFVVPDWLIFIGNHA
jgi:hypothetical protein